MKVDTFACDICGTQKKETNHWFMSWTTENPKGVTVILWTPELVRTDSTSHLCGIECATKWVAKQLSEGKGEKEKVST